MRHRISGKYLSRTTSHRSAMLRNLATSLVNHGVIETTLAKAKYVRPYVERLITKAKEGNGFNNVKYLKTKLTTDEAVKNLLEKIAPNYKNKTSGYTKIIRTGNRLGDNALTAKIELIKFVKAAKEKKERVKVEEISNGETEE